MLTLEVRESRGGERRGFQIKSLVGSVPIFPREVWNCGEGVPGVEPGFGVYARLGGSEEPRC